MLLPGNIDFTNGTLSIPAAGTYTTGVISNRAGILALGLTGIFTYGSGGTTCKVYLQTSFNSGTTYFDIACWAFATTTKTRNFNLSKLTPVTTAYTPTDAALTDDTVKDGLLGTYFRLKYVVVGTYASSTIQIAGDAS